TAVFQTVGKSRLPFAQPPSYRGRMRNVVTVTLTAAALALGGAAAPAAPQPGAAPAAVVKKKCKIVKKRVRGHIKRVPVCRTPNRAAPLPPTVSVPRASAPAAPASISPDAGAPLTAGGATLTVPAGAVAQTTTVTMTPVSKLGGLTGKVADAVQLEPNGLQL